VSNCLSVQPVETPYGRKTRIDQATCNLDTSCVRGDCPSFLTVTPRKRAVPKRPVAATGGTGGFGEPEVVVPTDDCTIRLSGIGGTGVVTVSQILGTAAMLDGFEVRGLDQTGLSQKAGPVVSDVRLSRTGPHPSNRASAGSVDTLLAFDLLVAASDAHVAGSAPERTMAVASSSAVATGTMVVHPERAYPHDEAVERLATSCRSVVTVDALGVTTSELGDAATANVYVLGVALQRGLVPVRPDRVEEAIRLNGVSVDRNLAAFRLGRRDADSVTVVADAAGSRVEREADGDARPAPETVDELIQRLADDLRDYQSRAYARRFVGEIERVRACGDDDLTRTAAVNLHRLMAYKDEYEVARLLLLPETRAAAEAVGGPGARVQWNLHPPLLRAMGLRRKLRLGRTATPLLAGLRSVRRVRGTLVDPFGRADVRRTERAMRDEYIEALQVVTGLFDQVGSAEARLIAGLPDSVRGYEDIKMRRAEAFRRDLADRLARITR
jgi:indolepyruvate ferredoxin oxidoreductase